MRSAAAYIIAVVVIIVFVGVAGEISIRSATCMACHTLEASFADWMKARLKAQNKGFSHELIACADCHISGSPEGTSLARFRGLLHVATYLVPQIDPREPRVSGMFRQRRVPRENCEYCHLGATERKAMLHKDLTPGLQKIGLLMDHRKHLLAREDTCARCHERYKEKGEADKSVAYTEVNHLSCDACHSSASHAYRSGRLFPITQAEYAQARQDAWTALARNPRWMVAIPSEETCRRCHDGKIHFKTAIFPANCRTGDDFENCVKCHPLMTRQYFEEYKKGRRNLTSAALQRGPDGRGGE